jgi:AmmeMemoRadiSam system protein A
MNYSADGDTVLAATYGETLLRVAAASIRHGLPSGKIMPVSADAYPAALQQPRATFVTLHEAGRLRGCIGTVAARHPLVESVAFNAHGAAFHDPRFPAVSANEWPQLSLSISILSPFETLTASSDAELLAEMRPGVDGLVLTHPAHRGVLLPQVWDLVPGAGAFLAALKEKAGLERDAWPTGLRAERFTTVSIPDTLFTALG